MADGNSDERTSEIARSRRTAFDEDLVELSSSFDLKRPFVIRSAGFPASGIEALSSSHLAAAVDEWLDAQQAYTMALRAARVEVRNTLEPNHPGRHKALKKLSRGRIPHHLGVEPEWNKMLEQLESHRLKVEELELLAQQKLDESNEELLQRLAEIAVDSRFVEALTWQNLRAAELVLPKVADPPPNSVSSKFRGRMQLVAKYFQRYTTKNDSIGFYGPSAWAELSGKVGESKSIASPSLLAKRCVLFEDWAIDAIAAQLARNSEILEWVEPRLHPQVRLDGNELHRSGSSPVAVSATMAEVLRACTGARSALEIASDLLGSGECDIEDEDEVLEILEAFVDKGLVLWDLEIPSFVDDGLQWLESRLSKMDCDAAREACDALSRLRKCREALEEAADDPEATATALKRLNSEFESIARVSAVRSAGEMYAGRTVMYLDCRRSVDLVIGKEFIDGVRAPLAAVIQSVDWMTSEGGRRFWPIVEEAYSKLRVAASSDVVELFDMFAEIGNATARIQNMVKALVAELNERWEEILEVGDSHTPIELDGKAVWEKAQKHFPRGVATWPTGIYQAPDLMVAASSFDEVVSGNALAVLGEIHAGIDSLSTPSFLRLAGDRDSLIQAFYDDVGPDYVEFVPRKAAVSMASNMSLAPEHVQIALESSPSLRRPDRVFRIANLVVEPKDSILVVRDRESGRLLEIGAVFQQVLRQHIVVAFSIAKKRRHTPRITIGNLVISREQWRIAGNEMPTFPSSRGLQQFADVRMWAKKRGFPRRVFYKSKEEVKPVYLDFDSPISVEIFVSILRQSTAMTISEMLPTPEQTWLADAEGKTYTSEMRLLAKSKQPWSPPSLVPDAGTGPE